MAHAETDGTGGGGETAVLVLRGGHCVGPGGRTQGLRGKCFSSAARGGGLGALKAVSGQTPRDGVRALATQAQPPLHPASRPCWAFVACGQRPARAARSRCREPVLGDRSAELWASPGPMSPPPATATALPRGAQRSLLSSEEPAPSLKPGPFCLFPGLLFSLPGPRGDVRADLPSGGGGELGAEVRQDDNLSRQGWCPGPRGGGRGEAGKCGCPRRGVQGTGPGSACPRGR